MVRSTLADTSGFRVRHRLGGGGKSGDKSRKKRSSIQRVIYQLRHIVNNNSGLTTSGGHTGLQTTNQKWGHHSQSRGLDRLHKGNSSQSMHDLRDFLGMGNGTQDIGSHMFNISVTNDITRSRHSSNCGIGNILLHIRHAGGNFGDDLRKSSSELISSSITEFGNNVQSQHTGLKVVFHLHGTKAIMDDFPDTVGTHTVNNGIASQHGSLSTRLLFVTSLSKNTWQECA